MGSRSFEIVVERETTETGYVQVEADSAEEAKKLAEAAPGTDVNWEAGNCTYSKHWAVDAEEI